MEKVKGSKEMLDELFNLQVNHPADYNPLLEFAGKIGACTGQDPGRTDYRELFQNCLNIINLRQQIEQSNVVSRQTFWIRWYTIATFALVGVTFVLAVIAALTAIFK